MKNIEYDNYKTLKKQFAFEYRGISMDRALALTIWFWANPTKGKSFLRLLIGFVRKFDYSFLENCDKEYILYSDITRADHSATFCDVVKRVDDKYASFNIKNGVPKRFAFSIANIFRAISLVFKNVNDGFIRKIGYSGHLCMCLNTIDNLNKLAIRPAKRFVAYSIVHETENLIAQFYNSKGTHVMGLTHGAQFEYKNGIPVDCINYENLNADCLVWGQMTKDEYINFGLPASTLFVAGYPKQVEIKDLSNDVDLKRCLVLLCRRQYEESNLHLLKLLSEAGSQYKFYIKLHPSCDFDFYAKICGEYGFEIVPKEVLLVECMDNSKYDFAIAVNTSSYYEILTAGIPCFRFDDNGAYDLQNGDEHDRISTVEDFAQGLFWLQQTMQDKTYDSIRRRLLEYNLGIGIDKYREILLG